MNIKNTKSKILNKNTENHNENYEKSYKEFILYIIKKLMENSKDINNLPPKRKTKDRRYKSSRFKEI